jgi:agmatinase
MRAKSGLLFLTCVQGVLAHDQTPLSGEHQPETWLTKYGKQIDLPFSGPLSFSHLPYVGFNACTGS